MTRDPDDGTINSGTYRVMIHDRNTLGLWISPGKDGDLHLKKYAERGEVAPISMTFGQSPLLYLAASKEIPHCEFDWVGGVMGEPLEVVAGDNGMPIPRYAEIAIEGEVRPGDKRQEGPFGEWTGYYASGEALAHVVHVNRVHFRHDPILTGSPSSKPPSEHTFSSCFMRSGMIWDELERSGVPDVTGVWCHPSGGGRMFTAVSIKQRYAGHATQAGMIATHGRASSYLGRYVVVVDEDIDVFNLTDVMWAVASRSDPSRDIRVMPDCRSGPLDPIIPPDRKGLNSRAVIDACRPYEWKDQFPPVATCGPELRRSVLQKWGDVIAGL
jgi:4-hydroxy-3-polyprenylbenzoate decarboxylase